MEFYFNMSNRSSSVPINCVNAVILHELRGKCNITYFQQSHSWKRGCFVFDAKIMGTTTPRHDQMFDVLDDSTQKLVSSLRVGISQRKAGLTPEALGEGKITTFLRTARMQMRTIHDTIFPSSISCWDCHHLPDPSAELLTAATSSGSKGDLLFVACRLYFLDLVLLAV